MKTLSEELRAIAPSLKDPVAKQAVILLVGELEKTPNANDVLARGLAGCFEGLRARTIEVDAMRKRKDEAYTERNRVVAAYARLAIAVGWKAGIKKTNIAGWHESWHNCCYIDTPQGQVSWHYHDDHRPLFEDLPAYDGAFDGHTVAQKYDRLHKMRPFVSSDHDGDLRTGDDAGDKPARKSWGA